jgi:hypothetical protein
MMTSGQFQFKDALTFGRPGCGAPARTKSGRLRTAIIGNQEIRFQPNESVQKTIYNTMRYQADAETKHNYSQALGKLQDFAFIHTFFRAQRGNSKKWSKNLKEF